MCLTSQCFSNYLKSLQVSEILIVKISHLTQFFRISFLPVLTSVTLRKKNVLGTKFACSG